MPGGWSRHGCRSTPCKRISRCESVEHLLDSRSFRRDIESGQTQQNVSGGRLQFGRGSAKVVPRGIAGQQVIDLDHRLKQFFSALVRTSRSPLIDSAAFLGVRQSGIDHKRIDFALVVATEHTQNYLGDPVRGGVIYPAAANSKNSLPWAVFWVGQYPLRKRYVNLAFACRQRWTLPNHPG